MSPLLVISILAGYFGLLIFISWLTGRKADTAAFFIANRRSPWYFVAFGMIGASLSGVTFISIPGWVGTSGFSYFQMVLGYLLGYLVIGTVLMPLYYRLNLISIYAYLEQRFGFWSYKTGAFFFLLSRTIGASFRLFLVAGVLQLALFDRWGVPFWVSVMVTILLIWIYTFRGGIKTIVWTDTLQTLFMLLAVVITIRLISEELNLSFENLVTTIKESQYSQVFFWDLKYLKDEKYFFKQFFAGAFIAIVMTGLDQDMMQKNLSCRNLKDAQKNMFWFSIILVFVNGLFLCLGALLFIYSNSKGIALPLNTDDLYPILALDHFSTFAGIIFLLGITAAAYSSADSALTALTTSFCVDFLNKDFTGQTDENIKRKIRYKVHVAFSVILFLMILIFKVINDENVISALFKAAGYTYGPLLGLYAFGLLTKWKTNDRAVPFVCLISPVICYILNVNSESWFGGYKFGFEILILNGLITFAGLMAFSGRFGNQK
ncbi:MAG: sodium:solute symporter [Bacteroidetes bacterium]|nr:sodium:solute symporter [Bacteroidota bacterium]